MAHPARGCSHPDESLAGTGGICGDGRVKIDTVHAAVGDGIGARQAKIRHLCAYLKTDRQPIEILARPAGFEPATYGLEIRCSIQLS